MTNDMAEVWDALSKVDVSDWIETKGKNGAKFVSAWRIWSIVKSRVSDAYFREIPQIVDELGNTRFYHLTETGGYIEMEVGSLSLGVKQTMILPVVDMRQQALPPDQINPKNASNTYARALAKCLAAAFGVSLSLWYGSDISEDLKETKALQAKVSKLAKELCTTKDGAEKVAMLCKEADAEANGIDISIANGNYLEIKDDQVLTILLRKLQKLQRDLRDSCASELKNIVDEINSTAKQMTKSKQLKAVDVVKKHTPNGEINPNAIVDVEEAKKCLTEIKEIK